MNLTAFIFARGGSKGLPRKNIKQLAGKPLIAWSIEQALHVNEISRVIVSTDDNEIASVAREFGAEVPYLRPAELAFDTTPEIFAWKHALQFIEKEEGLMPEPFISVPATSPLRLPSDISRCISKYKCGKADVVVTMCKAHRNPWFNMIKRTSMDTVSIVNVPSNKISRRQEAPVVFDITTAAYVANPRYILNSNDIFSGKIDAVEIPVERSIDIDTEYDFKIANFLMQERVHSND